MKLEGEKVGLNNTSIYIVAGSLLCIFVFFGAAVVRDWGTVAQRDAFLMFVLACAMLYNVFVGKTKSVDKEVAIIIAVVALSRALYKFVTSRNKDLNRTALFRNNIRGIVRALGKKKENGGKMSPDK